MLIKALKEATRALRSGHVPAAAEVPLEVESRLGALHAAAPVGEHLDRLFHDVLIGGERFVDLYSRCLEHTATAVTPFNVFQRFQTRLDMVRYLYSTANVPGARAECGVYRGATALLFCHALRARDPSYRGEDFYLIDSYCGTSASVDRDFVPMRDADGSVRMAPFFPPGKTDTSADIVRGYFEAYPAASVCAGWIPQVFDTLPERSWSYVHLDVTLFEPTLAALQYFYPRMSPGGAILCDNAPPFCPGADKAWEQFCESQGVPHVVLGHLMKVLIK